jgi:hypothetical protein
MKVPEFLKIENNSKALYNRDDESQLLFYVPEDFFNNNTKNPIAQIEGEFVSMIGICLWTIVDKNGKMSNPRLFKVPTMITCKPYKIEKVKQEKLPGVSDPEDYRILRFKYGDEVLSSIRTEESVYNAELMFKLLVYTAKIPTIIPADEIWKLLPESAELNGFSYNVNIQLYCMLISSILRSRTNISKEFRLTDMKDMLAYKPISIRMVPKYISPFTAIISENFDEGIRASVVMSQDMDEKDIPVSPLEKVLMQ